MKLIMELETQDGLIRMEKSIVGPALTRDLNEEKAKILKKMLDIMKIWEKED